MSMIEYSKTEVNTCEIYPVVDIAGMLRKSEKYQIVILSFMGI